MDTRTESMTLPQIAEKISRLSSVELETLEVLLDKTALSAIEASTEEFKLNQCLILKPKFAKIARPHSR